MVLSRSGSLLLGSGLLGSGRLGLILLGSDSLGLLLLGSDSLGLLLLSLAARASALANTRGTWSAGWTLKALGTRWTLSTRRALGTGTTTNTRVNDLQK
jgi:hypothetical protein